ncbi:MAG: ABC transporter ATP-binding protein [Anaerofustis sp.]
MELAIHDIVKSFGDKSVLSGINLSAKSGKAVGLLGRNGAGKTTTIRIIMGVFPPDSGTVTLDGKAFNRKSVKIGYLPEERGLYPKKKISEQLQYLGELRGMGKREAKQAYTALLERLEMGAYIEKKLETLSKGNQQKIQLAATLMTDPDIVIFDEPFSGLDPVNAMLLEDLVKEQINKGKIVLFSSHQMNYVEQFCDEIAILNEGNIVLSGNIRQIKRGYDRKDVVVTGESPERIASYVSEHLGGLVHSVRTEEGAARVSLNDAADKAKLFSALSEAGLDLDGLMVYEPSLNDIFVEYTGETE